MPTSILAAIAAVVALFCCTSIISLSRMLKELTERVGRLEDRTERYFDLSKETLDRALELSNEAWREFDHVLATITGKAPQA